MPPVWSCTRKYLPSDDRLFRKISDNRPAVYHEMGGGWNYMTVPNRGDPIDPTHPHFFFRLLTQPKDLIPPPVITCAVDGGPLL